MEEGVQISYLDDFKDGAEKFYICEFGSRFGWVATKPGEMEELSGDTNKENKNVERGLVNVGNTPNTDTNKGIWQSILKAVQILNPSLALSIDLIAKGIKWVGNYRDYKLYTPEETAQRAEKALADSKVLELDFSQPNINVQFAVWCKTGITEYSDTLTFLNHFSGENRARKDAIHKEYQRGFREGNKYAANKLADILEGNDKLMIGAFALGLYIYSLAPSDEKLDRVTEVLGAPTSPMFNAHVKSSIYDALRDLNQNPENLNFPKIRDQYFDSLKLPVPTKEKRNQLLEKLQALDQFVNELVSLSPDEQSRERQFLNNEWKPFMQETEGKLHGND